MKYTFLLCTILILYSVKLPAQATDIKSQEINLFIKCDANCDNSFIKTELTAVNYMYDRFEANVFLLISRQSTGSGGEKVTFNFEGQKEFAGISDTLIYYNENSDTEEIQRIRMVKMLKIGLIKYWLHTPLAEKLHIELPEIKGDSEKSANKPEKDKWDHWVFSLGSYGSTNKDDYQSSSSYNGSISASRVTEKFKFSSYNSINYRTSTWTYEDEKIVVNKNSGSSTNDAVISLNNHFSVGATASTGFDKYNNLKYFAGVKPALEYDVFRYKESAKKSLTFFYSVGPQFVKYYDTSYYNITEGEVLIENSLSVNLSLTQKWGNVYASGGWRNYLNSFKLEEKKVKGFDVNSLWISTGANVQLFKGFSVNGNVNFEFTKGVLPNIPRKEFLRDDLITNSRVYPTSKTLYLSCGINYRFGSKTNNVVNPRFNGGNMTYYSY